VIKSRGTGRRQPFFREKKAGALEKEGIDDTGLTALPTLMEGE
jgi:hypothetical protein